MSQPASRPHRRIVSPAADRPLGNSVGAIGWPAWPPAVSAAGSRRAGRGASALPRPSNDPDPPRGVARRSSLRRGLSG